MAGETISPNMGLPIPGVGVTHLLGVGQACIFFQRASWKPFNENVLIDFGMTTTSCSA